MDNTRWMQGGRGVRYPAGKSTWPLVVPIIHQQPPGVRVLKVRFLADDCLLYWPNRSITDQGVCFTKK